LKPGYANLLGTLLEEERYCDESNLFTLSNSVRGKWSEQGGGKGPKGRGKAA